MATPHRSKSYAALSAALFGGIALLYFGLSSRREIPVHSADESRTSAVLSHVDAPLGVSARDGESGNASSHGAAPLSAGVSPPLAGLRVLGAADAPSAARSVSAPAGAGQGENTTSALITVTENGYPLPSDMVRALNGPPPAIPADIKGQLKTPRLPLPEERRAQMKLGPQPLSGEMEGMLHNKAGLPEDLQAQLSSTAPSREVASPHSPKNGADEAPR